MMDQTNRRARQSPSGPRKFRFGSFEVDLELRELRSRGLRVRLQHKPFQVLELLLRNPGLLVRREELMQQLWPNLHVNFDHGLNTAVNTLRQVLGDSLRNCRYIETLPGLGYRLLMPVEAIAQAAPAQRGNFEAQQDYLKGKYFASKLNEDDFHKSIAYFESAIALDPGFAPAYAGLANAYTLGALLGTISPGEAHSRAMQLISTAHRIGDALPEAWVSLAGIKQLFDRDWSGAESECLRSLQSNPGYAGGRQAYATLLAVTERLDEALGEIRRAQELDPLSVVISMQMAWILYLARDFQSAIEQSWKALILEPQFAAAQHTLGLAYEQTGMMDEAITEFRNARSCSGHNPAAIAALGHAYSLAGEPREARQTLDELNEMSQRRYVSPYWKSVVCVSTQFAITLSSTAC
jgi:DNA-binding winged helix-turn-helix (wHTH) protein/Flp pilus assembly protein TadD